MHKVFLKSVISALLVLVCLFGAVGCGGTNGALERICEKLKNQRNPELALRVHL